MSYTVRVLTYMVAVVALLAAQATTAAESESAECSITSAQLTEVYDAAARDKIGDMMVGDTYSWWDKHPVPAGDKDTIKAILYITKDWVKPNPKFDWQFRHAWWTDYSRKLREITSNIQDRCARNVRNRICRNTYDSVSACEAHYSNLYLPLIQRADQKLTSLRTEALSKSEQARGKVLAGFAVPEDRLVLVGTFVTRQPVIDKPGVRPQPVEFANKLTETDMKAFLDAPLKVSARGEFESKAEYEARVRSAAADHTKLLESRRNHQKVAYRDLLERNLNAAFGKPSLGKDEIRYDADIEAFRIPIVFEISKKHMEFWLKQPRAGAKAVKEKLMNQDYWPQIWMVYEMRDGMLYLRGGVLSPFLTEDSDSPPTRLDLARADHIGVRLGAQATKEFEALMDRESQKAALAEQQARVTRCETLAKVLSIRNPDNYLPIMQVNGCM
jgi:hypothetical protein